MTDRIPPYAKNVDRAVANAARLQDVKQREKAARPIDTGRDILAGFDSDGTPNVIDMRHSGSR